MASRLRHRQATEKRRFALSNPLRLAIFRILTERTASIAEMTKELGLPREKIGDVRYHTHKLVELGCAEEVGQREEGGKVIRIYKATERVLIDTDEWAETMKANSVEADHYLGELFQAQIDDAAAALGGRSIDDELFHITHTPCVMDLQGLEESMEVYERARLEVAEIERRAAARRSDSGDDAIRVSSNFALFKMPPSA